MAAVRKVEGDAQVGDCTTVELLAECQRRLELDRDTLGEKDLRAGPRAGREFSTAITHVEDAIMRANRGRYMVRGTFQVTDAEVS